MRLITSLKIAKKSLLQMLQCLEDKGMAPKTKLECMNRLLELSKPITDISNVVSVVYFLKWYVDYDNNA